MEPGIFFLFVIVAGVVIFGFWAVAIGLISSSPAPPPEKTAEDYNAGTVLMAAKKNYLDIQTELRKSEIEAARVEALHKERDEIIAHDRKVRGLNAELDVKRSS